MTVEPPAIEPTRTWGTIPEGHHLEWAVDPKWRTPSQYRICRAGMPGHARCPNAPVADINRGAFRHSIGRVDHWWAYCAEHIYGREVHYGYVWQVVLRGDAQVDDA